jgi:FKBP-type peptidyl-prolyl cis-trans isomerase 2
MKINKGDFIELDYTARTADDGAIFDTTELDAAKEAGKLHDHDAHGHDEHDHDHGHGHLHKEDLKPAIICVGEKQILPGLDQKIEGLEIGKHKIALDETEAFGKKDAKMLKLMPVKLFQEQEIRPFVGLVLDIDGQRGVVRSISGGRVIVDFNHPLAGKKVEYTVDVKRIVTDKKEQLSAVLKMLRFPYSSIDIKESSAEVKTEIELPEEMVKTLEAELSRQVGLAVKIHSTKKAPADKIPAKKSEKSEQKTDEKSEEKSE